MDLGSCNFFILRKVETPDTKPITTLKKRHSELDSESHMDAETSSA